MPSPTTSGSTSNVGLSTALNINALIAGTKWGGATGTGTALTYSFPWTNSGTATFSGGNGIGDYSSLNEQDATYHYGLNATEQASARGALQSWANIANITFSEVAESSSNVGDIRFAWTSASNSSAWGWAYYPNSYWPSAGDVWISTRASGATDQDWSSASYNFNALVHEVGHVLGLKHPFEDYPVLPAGLDSQQYTIMSYTEPPNDLFRDVTANPNGTYSYSYSHVVSDTPMLYDLAAIQYLYGVNLSYKTGNDVYTFDADTPFYRTIWDANGDDTLSVSNFAKGCVIDLRQGHFSKITIDSDPLPPGAYGGTTPTYDGTDNLAIAFGCVIENATGGSGDDTLIGNDADNTLQGGPGNDTLDGGQGTDTASYAGSRANYTISVTTNGFMVTSAAHGTDVLTGMEYAAFADQTIALTVSDTTAPVVTITDNLAGAATLNTPSVTYSLQFSEPVTGLDSSDFNVTNGTVNSVSGAGSSWTVSIAPGAGVASSTIGLTLKAGAVADAAGNANAIATNTSQAIDTVAPVAPKLVTTAAFNFLVNPQVTLQTSLGTMVLELNPEQAPITVANMLAYVNSGFYNNTLIHRVIPGFMVQGGGFNTGLSYKDPTYSAIALESNNGLSNLRGTIAMARSSDADSATTQFFVNQVDNTYLDYSNPASPGYAVFGRVVSGLAVIDSMANVPTTTRSTHANVPVTDVTITAFGQTLAGSSTANAATLAVVGLEAGARWSYSLNSGASWTTGSGDHLTVPVGSYAASAIQVRQTDAAGNISASTGKFTSALVVDTTAPTVNSFSPLDEATGITIGSNIVVTFSEAIANGTGSIILKTAAGATVATYDAASSSNLTISGSTLTINPTSDLVYSTGYKVEFAAGTIKDLAGNSYAGTTSYNFTTTTTSAGLTLTGTSANDFFRGGTGNDTIDGGDGVDTTLFAGNRANYQLTHTVAGWTVSSAASGTDILQNVERLQFDDKTVALDINGIAGQAYRVYQAAFDRTPDNSGLKFWISTMDNGASLDSVAAGFINSAEFQALYGANPTNQQFVSKLYSNVLHRTPDQGGYDYWTTLLDSNGISKAVALREFSESPENQAGVIGVIQNGIELLN